MADQSVFESARWQLTVCNACRYCEGYCAVFPALERLTVHADPDITYLANLCHDCRACLDACMYAPPHEFGVDIPAAMRQVREASYVRFAWPRRIAALMWHYPRSTVSIATLCAFGAALVAEVANGRSLIGGSGRPGSFYVVIPWLGMVIAFGTALLFAIGVISCAMLSFSRSTTGAGRRVGHRNAWRGAIADIVPLRYLGGGGAGCPSPEGTRPSHARRVLHQLVLYGFCLDFASTVAAAIYQDLLHQMPPYPVASPPVLLGIIGGVGIIAGCCGLLYLRREARRLGTWMMSHQDLAFVSVLSLVAVSGMLVLAFRSTAAMPVLLDTHLACVFALFLTLPYGKFVHATYRVAALVRNRFEEAADDGAAPESPSPIPSSDAPLIGGVSR